MNESTAHTGRSGLSKAANKEGAPSTGGVGDNAPTEPATGNTIPTANGQ